MTHSRSINIIITASLFALGLAGLYSQAVYGKSSDAIAMRVMANPSHFSASRWYDENVKLKGAPQMLTVDGYPAVRDGRTVYVSGANVDIAGGNLYTNIYIISYNQDAEPATQDIFGKILANWRFNINLESVAGICSERPAKNCLVDTDCLGDGFCTSFKARTVRDTIRMARLTDIATLLSSYRAKQGKYPALSAGSFVAGKTLSVWPSWQETFSKTLDASGLPIDPINELADCPGYEAGSCWDQTNRRFAWPGDLAANQIPAGNFTFLYNSETGASYKLCANSETGLMDAALSCNAACVPFCFGRDCGDDGCSGSCGSCLASETCVFSSCTANCSTPPGCRASLANGYIVLSGYCAVGDCYACNAGWNWNPVISACDSSCVPDGCNGICPFSCAASDDPDCSPGICGDACCSGGETGASCAIDCPACSDSDDDNYSASGGGGCCGAANDQPCPATPDCADANAARNPGAAEICGNGIDEDCSGADLPCACLDADNDDYSAAGGGSCCGVANDQPCPATPDCADANAARNPGAAEICGNGIDEDCSGADLPCACLDADNDDYSAAGGGSCCGVANDQPCPAAPDCDDTDATAYPGAIEVCDDLDNNCMNGVDEGCNNDGDGYCDSMMFFFGFPVAVCPATNLPDGSLGNDCNDTVAAINPGQAEQCANTIDDNCNGLVDCLDLAACGAFPGCATCTDVDGDGYGTAGSSGCPSAGVDCDDGNAARNPGAAEICNGADDDCDGTIDEGCDQDNDNFCSCSQVITVGSDLTAVCPLTNTANAGSIAATCDCNDTIGAGASINPGASEICNNGQDDNCSGQIDCLDLAACSASPFCITCTDADDDDYSAAGGGSCCGPANNAACPAAADCDEGSAARNPGAAEICGNGIDEDCSGADLICPPPSCTFPATLPCDFP